MNLYNGELFFLDQVIVKQTVVNEPIVKQIVVCRTGEFRTTASHIITAAEVNLDPTILKETNLVQTIMDPAIMNHVIND